MLQKLQAFLDGYKPAILVSHRYENAFLEKLQPLGYPHTIQYELEDFDDPTILFDRGTLFFQNQSMMTEYLEEIHNATSHDQENMILGKYLGYPPIASDYFINYFWKDKLKEKNACFNYAGIQFAGNIDDKNAICDWLWSNINISPQPVEVEFNGVTMLLEPTVVTV